MARKYNVKTKTLKNRKKLVYSNFGFTREALRLHAVAARSAGGA